MCLRISKFYKFVSSQLIRICKRECVYKGKFSTNIGDEVINAALESVRKHSGETKAPDTTPSEGTPATQPAVEVKVETVSSGEEPVKEIESLKAQLELSQEQGRTSMGRIVTFPQILAALAACAALPGLMALVFRKR